MARAPSASAIVLAGGRSSRFGRDKLAEPIDGRPLLLHAIDAVRPIASEVLVVAAPEANPAVPPDVIVARDPSRYEGPLAGLAAGLRAANEPVCLIVGGDSPSLVSAVLGLLVEALVDEAIEAAALDDDGSLRPLPCAVRREAALEVSERLLADGQRRLRLVFETLRTRTIPEVAWRALDAEGATLRDIDTPGDLAKP